ncbi:MAG: gtuS20 [Frankiales bacterium]|nr:gtuS20 [Frankiales bacterium]
MPDQSVTVVIVAFNSAGVLAECLEAIPAAMTGVEGWRVVVADNASVDGSLDVVARVMPDALRVATGGNLGYAGGINAGLAAAAPQGHVLVMNPDVRMKPGSVAPLVDAVVRGRHVGIAVPKLVTPGGELLWSLRRRPTALRTLGEAVLGGERAGRSTLLGEVVRTPARYSSSHVVEWASGAVMLVSGACRESLGEWDDSFFLYSEETEYCLRARAQGLRTAYIPESVAVHLEGELESSAPLRRILLRNKLRLYARTHSPLATAAFRGALLINEGVRAAKGSRLHRAGLRELLTVSSTGTTTAADLGRLSRGTAPAPGAGSDAFVFFSAQDYWYHNRAHSDFQLARHIAAEHPLLLVNSIGMRMPLPGRSTQPWMRILRKLKSVLRMVRRPEPSLPRLAVMTPFVLPFYGSPFLRAVNARIVRWQVTAVLRSMGVKRPHAIVTIPTAWDVVKKMRTASVLANRSDRYSVFGETDMDSIRQMELQLLAACDAAFFVSHRLLEEERALVGGDAVFLGHGVDYDHFASARGSVPPDDIASIPTPRIGFFGGLDDYVIDFPLLKEIALQIPEASLVLIGDSTYPMDELVAIPNVHWLGARPYADIPRYGAAFDVGIMPWSDSDWIQYCNPIKLKEYLALGLPIVSTDYPEVHLMSDVIDVGKDHAEFIAAVRRALAGDGLGTVAERQAKVHDDSWESRAHLVVDAARAAQVKAGR